MIYLCNDSIKEIPQIANIQAGFCVCLYKKINESKAFTLLNKTHLTISATHIDILKEEYIGLIQYCLIKDNILFSKGIFFNIYHQVFEIIIEDEQLYNQINELIKGMIAPLTLEKAVCIVLEHLLIQDKNVIGQCLNMLNDLDEKVLQNDTKDFLQTTRIHHQLLRKLNDEMVGKIDVCEVLMEDVNNLFKSSERYHMRSVLKRYERAKNDMIQGKEYIMQIRESYQNQVDIQLNQMMYIFTIVTIICLPLTIIVGWYGMNVKMPEFGWEYGYLFVILLAVVSLAICTTIMIRKKFIHRK